MMEDEGDLMKLELGCGKEKRNGFVGIDYRKFDDVDMILDLETQKIPLDNNTVDYIYSYHFLEHIQNLMDLMEECYRIMKVNTIFEAIVPILSFDSPTHKRFFTYQTFDWWNIKHPYHYEVGNSHFQMIKKNIEINRKWFCLDLHVYMKKWEVIR